MSWHEEVQVSRASGVSIPLIVLPARVSRRTRKGGSTHPSPGPDAASETSTPQLTLRSASGIENALRERYPAERRPYPAERWSRCVRTSAGSAGQRDPYGLKKPNDPGFPAPRTDSENQAMPRASPYIRIGSQKVGFRRSIRSGGKTTALRSPSTPALPGSFLPFFLRFSPFI